METKGKDRKRIAVLVSGGVDSAVVVDRLYREGHDLHLFYIRIGMDNGEGDCSAEEDIEICTLIARKYGLPFQVVSLHEEYWDNVMAYTLRSVKEGLTPHPDMMCNKLIKFGYFEQRWGKDFDRTATGHYARIEERDGRLYLATTPDAVKDQTDFLAQISYEQLSHLMFPLGDMTKEEVREAARVAKLPNATRKDSQGICFLGKINYNDFLRRHLGEKEGPIIEIETGKKIGTHKGYWFHTIGQRKGLGLSGGPWFVVRKNVRDNVIFVSRCLERRLQYGRTLPLESMHWITCDPFAEGQERMEITFKNRHCPEMTDGVMVRVIDGDGIRYEIESEEDIQGIAPGQFAIVYTRDRRLCLGSGMISAPAHAHRHRRVTRENKRNQKETN